MTARIPGSGSSYFVDRLNRGGEHATILNQ
jgi:hypothetical protein